MGMGSEGCAPASQSKIDDVTTRVLGYEDVTAGHGFVEVMPGPVWGWNWTRKRCGCTAWRSRLLKKAHLR